MKNKNKSLKLKPKYWFLCEWETEKCYFSIWNNKFKKEKISVEIKCIWQVSGINKYKIENIRKKINYNNNQLKKTWSKVFVLLDIDWYKRNSYSTENINFIKKNLENDNIKVLFSNKNFELWILLHLKNFDKENWDYINEIQKYNETYKKWKNNCNVQFFTKILDKDLNTAIERAEKLEKKYENKLNLKDKIPYTEIYKIFN